MMTEQTGKGGRTRMKAEERRALILARAKKVFAQHSYAESSTSLLARESDVTEPMLYKHFGSKKGLFLAVLREYSQNFFERWQERIAQRAAQSPLEALANIVLDYNEVMQADPDVHKVLHQAVAETNDPDFSSRVGWHNRRIYASVYNLLERAQEQGLLVEAIDLQAATWGYLSMITAMQYSDVLNVRTELNDEVLAKMNRIWLRGLLRSDLQDT